MFKKVYLYLALVLFSWPCQALVCFLPDAGDCGFGGSAINRVEDDCPSGYAISVGNCVEKNAVCNTGWTLGANTVVSPKGYRCRQCVEKECPNGNSLTCTEEGQTIAYESRCLGNNYGSCPYCREGEEETTPEEEGGTCPDGYDTNVSCGSGQAKSTHPTISGCEKCVCDTANGYQASLEGCGTTGSDGWKFTTSNACNKCVEKTCADHGKQVGSCAEGYQTNEEWVYLGDANSLCYSCTEITCTNGSSLNPTCGTGQVAQPVAEGNQCKTCECDSDNGWTESQPYATQLYYDSVTSNGKTCYQPYACNNDNGYYDSIYDFYHYNELVVTYSDPTDYGDFSCYEVTGCATGGHVVTSAEYEASYFYDTYSYSSRPPFYSSQELTFSPTVSCRFIEGCWGDFGDLGSGCDGVRRHSGGIYSVGSCPENHEAMGDVYTLAGYSCQQCIGNCAHWHCADEEDKDGLCIDASQNGGVGTYDGRFQRCYSSVDRTIDKLDNRKCYKTSISNYNCYYTIAIYDYTGNSNTINETNSSSIQWGKWSYSNNAQSLYSYGIQPESDSEHPVSITATSVLDSNVSLTCYAGCRAYGYSPGTCSNNTYDPELNLVHTCYNISDYPSDKPEYIVNNCHYWTTPMWYCSDYPCELSEDRTECYIVEECDPNNSNCIPAGGLLSSGDEAHKVKVGPRYTYQPGKNHHGQALYCWVTTLAGSGNSYYQDTCHTCYLPAD